MKSDISRILENQISRREFISAAAMFGAGITCTIGSFGASASSEKLTNKIKSLYPSKSAELQVLSDYSAQTLLRWGDAVFHNSPPFEIEKLSAESQSRQFGYNCDYIAFMPLPYGSQNSTHGLLHVNHEHTNTELMFAGITKAERYSKPTEEQAMVEMAAHGFSVVEIKRDANAKWQVVLNSKYNRRINGLNSVVAISGPCKSHKRLQTKADSAAEEVIGTLGNCAGGVTPWGTVLTCEENIDNYFAGKISGSEKNNLERFGFRSKHYSWSRYYERFNLDVEPNEANRYGWVVEYDPYNPDAVPVKRTALGRFKHEGANTAITADGRLAVYMGDDSVFEYLYKFVTRDKINWHNREENFNLLDNGILYVARFNDDNTMQWLPLIYGQNGLDIQNGFESQADVLIEARRAADIVGATTMDRVEDVEVHPITGGVYVVCTKNAKRAAENINIANPEAENFHGHIIEISPPAIAGKVDHGAEKMPWKFFAFGAPPVADGKAGWFSCPDNICFSNDGRVWVATDGAEDSTGFTDGVCVLTNNGKAMIRFLNVPVGAEATGICFTPDNSTMFLSVQHPADGSTFDSPSTRWPDFNAHITPRPSVIAISKKGRGAL